MINQQIDQAKQYFQLLQKTICNALNVLDEKKAFVPDPWRGILKGEGLTCVLSNGRVIEKGGVNFSFVSGEALPESATAHRPKLAGLPFYATGISFVIHPKNPHVPTTHGNLRLFLVEKKNKKMFWWFGGGIDLTPYYPVTEDCIHWHHTAKIACEPFGTDIYPEFKKWADTYFYLKHRNECRGIGGLFFDDLNRWDFDKTFEFIQSIGNCFLLAYLPIVKRRYNIIFTQSERDFQLYRRGRYVEFNLLYDRGTLFGLKSGGRTESILMSLPPLVRWDYAYAAEPNSPEEKLTQYYLQPKEWL